jgi:hypothetical protein
MKRLYNRLDGWVEKDRERAIRLVCRLQGVVIGTVVGTLVEALHVTLYGHPWT